MTDTLKILDGSFAVDKALADAYQNGGADAYLLKELIRTMRQKLFAAESQVINGVNSDAGGFVGLRDDAQLNALADTMVVEAGTAGTTADVQTSVYLVRSGDDDVAVIAGNDGNFDVAEEPVVIEKVVNPGTDNKVYPAYYTAVCGHMGLQYGGAFSAARLCNVETALTDDDIYNALSQFPASRPPTHIAMNRTALKLLRNSRTATNATGTGAPFPTEVEGIPIVVSDAVTSTEAIVA